jgi:O-antigen ligase
MKLTNKSKSKVNFDITDYYAVNIHPIWEELKKESASFWWLCIYFFFEYVRPQVIYPAIDILPYGYITLSIACITALTDRNVKWVANPMNTLLAVFLTVVLLSSILAFNPSTSFEKFIIIVNWIVLYYLIITVINTEKRFLIFMLLFFLVNFKMSQFGFRDLLGRGFGYSKWGVSGSPGWFKDAGDLGVEMGIFVPLSIAFALALKDYWGRSKKLLFYFIPVTGIATILATSARGAQLGILAASLWFLFKNHNFKSILAVILLGWLTFSLLPEGMIEEYHEAGEDSTSRTRLALWAFGMDVANDNPLLGVGYANWLDYCEYINPVLPDIDHCLVAHSAYITVVAETGYIGLALYILLAIAILVGNARTRANAKMLNNKFLLYTANALDAGLISYLVSSTFFSVNWYPFFWVQLSMTVALYQISKSLHSNMLKASQVE